MRQARIKIYFRIRKLKRANVVRYTCKMKDFKKYYQLNATADEVYQAITNPLSIKIWTNSETVMSTEPNSEFSMFDGEISGRNIEFEENKKVIQEWYFGETDTPSIVTIKLFPKNEGTSIHLVHTNIPDDAFDEMVEGWDDIYFGQLEEFFSE